MRFAWQIALVAALATGIAATEASAGFVLAGNSPNQISLKQEVVNSDGTSTTPIQVSDGSSTPLDQQAGNADGSSRASADTGILRAKANVTGPGPATRFLEQLGNGSFTDSFIINSASPDPVLVIIPFLVHGSVPEAHISPFGSGTAGFTSTVQIEAATGRQPGGSYTINFFTDNVFDSTDNLGACPDTGMGTEVCLYSNNYDYTSANSFDGTINTGFEMAANTQFYMNMQFSAMAESYIPSGFPASSDFFDTAIFGGFILPDGDTVTSGLIGPLTERDGVYNYPSVWAYIDSLTAVPEPGSLSLLSIGVAGVMFGRRRRAAAQSAAQN
jgi:PEP-CTERM motif